VKEKQGRIRAGRHLNRREGGGKCRSGLDGEDWGAEWREVREWGGYGGKRRWVGEEGRGKGEEMKEGGNGGR